MSKKNIKRKCIKFNTKINQNKMLNKNGNKYPRVRFIDTHTLSVTYWLKNLNIHRLSIEFRYLYDYQII